MLLYQNQPETPGSLGRTRGSSRAPATVDGCNGGSRRRVRDPSLVEAGVSEEEGRTGSGGEGRFLVKRLSRACMEKTDDKH